MEGKSCRAWLSLSTISGQVYIFTRLWGVRENPEIVPNHQNKILMLCFGIWLKKLPHGCTGLT